VSNIAMVDFSSFTVLCGHLLLPSHDHFYTMFVNILICWFFRLIFSAGAACKML
jgi:hypothetical protein